MSLRARRRASRFLVWSSWRRTPALNDQFQRSSPILESGGDDEAHRAGRDRRRQRLVSPYLATDQSADRSSVMNVQGAPEATSILPEPFLRWFASRGWEPREHQLELFAKARGGRSVLLIAPTGAGKTLAGFLPSSVELSTVPRVGPASFVRMPSTPAALRTE